VRHSHFMKVYSMKVYFYQMEQKEQAVVLLDLGRS
jgi:hypothetical protein